MRRHGIWHPRLAHVLTALGHGDLLVVADAGLPVPPHVESVDLVWAAGEPAFLPVVRAIVDEAVFEGAVVARELADADLRASLGALFLREDLREVSHEELKRLMADARVVVRTGSVTPYANVVLIAGVAF